MNIWLKCLIMFSAELFVYNYLGKWLGLICLIGILYKLLYDIGFLRKVKLSKGRFEEGTFYFKDFTMPYKKIPEAFVEVNQIQTKFKLQNQLFFLGIYYDCELTEPSKQRASIGLFKKKSSSFNTEEMEKYALENGYRKCILPSSNSIYSRWEFPFFLALYIGISKFSSELKQLIENKSFRRTVDMKTEDKTKCGVELYDTYNSVCFYVPLEEQKSFLVHSSFKFQ